MVVLRRVVTRDGRSRAAVNDQPVGVGLLRRVGALLVEIQGQHEQMGLADQATHLDLLDAFGVAPALRDAVRSCHATGSPPAPRWQRRARAVEAAAREEDWLRQSVQDLSGLNPQPDEEAELAGTRQALQQGERRAEAIAAALAELSPRDRRNGGPAAALRAASRALQRLLPTGSDPQPTDADAPAAETAQASAHRAQAALEALDHAEAALADAEGLLSRLAADQDGDPRLLEQTEERLFALRAGARKHGVAVVELPALLAGLRARLEALESGQARIAELERGGGGHPCRLRGRGPALGAARTTAARAARARGDRRVATAAAGARPLHRLAGAAAAGAWTARGMEQASFLIAANPGQPPGPLARVASGGELSRLMLALKVVLAGRSRCPPWCSTRSIAASAAPPPPRSASGWRGWPTACRCWW